MERDSDLFQILGIENPNATDAEIRKAFKKLAIKFHPDKVKPEEREKAEMTFKEILNAYEILTNKERDTIHEFSSFFYNWKAADWNNFFSNFFEGTFCSVTPPNLNYENKTEETEDFADEIKNYREKVWTAEDQVSKKERRQRALLRQPTIKITKIKEILPWEEYYKTQPILSLFKQKQKLEFEFGYNEVINNKVALWFGSITTLEVDCIVNPTDPYFHGGMVTSAIRRGATRSIDEETNLYTFCKTGDAKITRGYHLPSKYVLHAAGPKDRDPVKLASCYYSCLELAKIYKIKTICFPGISCGMNSYPFKEAYKVSLETVRRWLELEDNKNAIDLIVFNCFEQPEMNFASEAMQYYFPFPQLLE